jgi:hypothetical protein
MEWPERKSRSYIYELPCSIYPYQYAEKVVLSGELDIHIFSKSRPKSTTGNYFKAASV